MSSTVIYIIIGFVIIYAGIFYYTMQRRKKLKAAFSNLDMRAEAANAEGYKNELIDREYAFLRKQMNGSPIDAFTIASIEYTAKSQAKDMAKDALKGLATLGTVKFTTVQTPKFLVLSGDDLHLFDTNTDGDIDKHLIFDKFRLQNSRIEEIALTSAQRMASKMTGFETKRYKFSLETDGKDITIMLFNMVMPDLSNGVGSAFSGTENQVKKFVVGNYFLKKLGDKVPGLKTPTAFPA